MLGDARLLILETRQVALDNTAVLTLKPVDQTWSRLTQLIIVVIYISFLVLLPRNLSL